MFYIHKTSCISPQHSFKDINLEELVESKDKRLTAIEPSYDMIPAGVLRRMGKAVRMGVGAAMPLIKKDAELDGIIIGSANCGKEDCVKFLNQIIEYDEGMLTPLNFVQGTPNSVAAQIGLLTKNHAYNITHLQLGLSFEFAMLDVDMKLGEYPHHNYLLGAVDDVSLSYYYFEDKGGSYKQEEVSSKDLYKSTTTGSIAGEAAAMFLVNAEKQDAIAKVVAVDTLHSDDEGMISERLKRFIDEQVAAGVEIDVLLSGENGDKRLKDFYTFGESVVGAECGVLRFKHMSGEYPTTTAMGLWICCEIFSGRKIPAHMVKKSGTDKIPRSILIYNIYKGYQHSFILVSA